MTVSESNGVKEKPDEGKHGRKEELLVNIQRLTSIVLDKLEQGCEDGTLDQAQIRLLGSIGMRALGLWQDTLSPPSPRRSSRKRDEEAAAQIAADTTYVS